MVRVAVLDDWQGIAESLADWSGVRAKAELVVFREAFADVAATIAALRDFEVVVAMRERTRLHKDVIDALPKLKLLSFTGARNAAVDIPACTARGVTVCNTTGGGAPYDTAELALGLLLAAARHVPLGDAEVRAGRFQTRVPPGIGLEGRTLGVIGLGRLGGRMAGYGRALGMTVLGWSQNLADARAAELGVQKVDKAALLARSDAVSLHLVLSERTRGIVGASDIAAMKPGAILVNTSRGPLVDEAALVTALRAGKIRAALDVFDREPLPAGHPLLTVPNTVLAPHLGYVTVDNMRHLHQASAENVAAWLAGAPVNVVNASA